MNDEDIFWSVLWKRIIFAILILIETLSALDLAHSIVVGWMVASGKATPGQAACAVNLTADTNTCAIILSDRK